MPNPRYGTSSAIHPIGESPPVAKSRIFAMPVSPRHYYRFTGLLIISATIALSLPARSLTIPTIDNISHTLNIGGTSLKVPPPEGFVPITSDMQGLQSAIDQAEQSATSTNSKLEAFFVSQVDADAARAGKLTAIGSRYVTVLSSIPLATTALEPKDMNELKAGFAKLSQTDQTKTIKDNVNRGPQSQATQVSDLQILPTVDLSDRSFLSPMVIQRENATADGQTVAEHFTGSTVIMLVKDRVISSNIYGDPNDLAWEQSLAQTWVPTVLAQNPPIDLPTTQSPPESPSFRFGNTIGRTIGVILGTTIGGWILRKRQQKTAEKPVE
jgi:hypothetical protein